MLEFIPRAQLRDRLTEGWRLVPGHEYNVNDWAILMALDEAPEPITDFRINLLVGRFNPVQRRRQSNKSAANSATNKQRWDNYRERLARLEHA